MVCAGRTQTDYAHFSVPTGAGGGRITFSWDPVQGESEQMRVYLHDENGDPVQRAEGKSPLVIDVKKWHRTDYQLSTWFNTDVAGAVDQHVDWRVEIV